MGCSSLSGIAPFQVDLKSGAHQLDCPRKNQVTPRQAAAFVRKHGIVLESAAGPVPSLAFRDRRKVTLDGETLLGDRAVREVWVCGPGAYLAPQALAFRALLDDPAAQDALRILRADFSTQDSVGAMRAAAFLGRQADAAFLPDVAGFAREFFRLFGEPGRFPRLRP